MVNNSDIPSWCQEDIIPSHLQDSAIKFLKKLNLPGIHPHCMSSSMTVSPIVEEVDLASDYSFLERFVTLCWQIFPPLFAIGELWLRLFAGLIAPLVFCYLLNIYFQPLEMNRNQTTSKRSYLFCVCGVASAAVLLTDAMYVQEFGRLYGASLLISLLTLLRLLELPIKKKSSCKYRMPDLYRMSVVMIMVLSLLALMNDVRAGDKSIDIPDVEAGLYHSTKNSKISQIVHTWKSESEVSLDYDEIATKYLITGDALTGIPFLFNNKVPEPVYIRRWVPVPEDGEAVALDIAFPSSGVHNSSMPVYLVLHGLNGGSREEFIMDFVLRETKRGSTVCVMIARGLMDTPVFGANIFHGARVTDVNAAAKALKRSLVKGQTLAGAGYSMGAIVLANYVSRSGKRCFLDAAVVVSGGVDMRPQAKFWRSRRLWQPMLAQEARTTLLGKYIHLYKNKLSSYDFTNLLRAPDIFKVDIHGIASYNNFDGVLDYYSNMSACAEDRIEKVSIPLCVIHALDDPLITWRSVGKPESLIESGQGKVVMLITRSGGHVGWPISYTPASKGWVWMNEATSSFVRSVHKVL